MLEAAVDDIVCIDAGMEMVIQMCKVAVMGMEMAMGLMAMANGDGVCDGGGGGRDDRDVVDGYIGDVATDQSVCSEDTHTHTHTATDKM